MSEMKSARPQTVAAHAGRDPFSNHGIVNPPVYHASTVLFETMADMQRAPRPGETRYGRYGTPTTRALEEAVSAMEGAHATVSVSSGMAAITTALLAYVRAGDHILVSDGAYFPTRKYCDEALTRIGVETTYFDPMMGGDVASLIRPNTRVVFSESPSSLTFETPDSPAIAAAARAHGAVSMIDATWGGLMYFPAFDHGYDVTIHAGTKYVVGHADAMMGLIGCRDAEVEKAVRTMAHLLGQCAGPDDCYLALRGLRTLPLRLKAHWEAGVEIAKWLQSRPEVARVLHPALPDDPGHERWRRDFTGACGLFGVILNPAPREAVAAMVENMHLFKMGFSWGGYESLMIPTTPETSRTATEWTADGQCLRLHIGLEAIEDLIMDLTEGFGRLVAATK